MGKSHYLYAHYLNLIYSVYNVMGLSAFLVVLDFIIFMVLFAFLSLSLFSIIVHGF